MTARTRQVVGDTVNRALDVAGLNLWHGRIDLAAYALWVAAATLWKCCVWIPFTHRAASAWAFIKSKCAR